MVAQVAVNHPVSYLGGSNPSYPTIAHSPSGCWDYADNVVALGSTPKWATMLYAVLVSVRLHRMDRMGEASPIVYGNKPL